MDTNQEGHGLSFLENMSQDKIRHDMLEAGTHGHPSLNAHLDVAPEVAAALAVGRPVVALESTIISHGMPYPQNVETALRVEAAIRACGAVPATIAVLGGRLKAGLSASEIEHLGAMGRSVAKASRRDLALLVARKEDGACTVATLLRRWPASKCSQRAELAVCTGAPQRLSTSLQTWRNSPARRLW